MNLNLLSPAFSVPDPTVLRGKAVPDRSGSIQRQARFFDADVSVSKLAHRIELPCSISFGDQLKIRYAAVTKAMEQQLNRWLGRNTSSTPSATTTLDRDLLKQWRDRACNRKPEFKAKLFTYPMAAPVQLKNYSCSDESGHSPSVTAPAQRSVSVRGLSSEHAPVVRPENGSTVLVGKEVETPDSVLDTMYTKLVAGSPTGAERLDSLLASVVSLQQQDKREGVQRQGGASPTASGTSTVARFMALIDGLSLEKSRALLDALMQVDFSAQIVLVRAQNSLDVSESKRRDLQDSNVLLVALIEKLHIQHKRPFIPIAYQNQAFREEFLTTAERAALLNLLADKTGRKGEA